MSDVRKATEFTVVRSRWFRGRPHGSRLLRSTDGRMCCMGFYALACGATEDQIRDLGSLAEIDARAMLDIELDVVFGGDPDVVALQVYNLNDSTGITEAEREARLTRMLASRGVTVTFVD